MVWDMVVFDGSDGLRWCFASESDVCCLGLFAELYVMCDHQACIYNYRVIADCDLT